MTFVLGSRLIRLLTLDRYVITFNNALSNAVSLTAVDLTFNVSLSAFTPAVITPVSVPFKVNTLITGVIIVTKALITVTIKGDG